MDKRRRMLVFHRWDHCPPGIKSEHALVEVPGEWVHGVVALVRASQEFRHSGLMVTNVGPHSEAARSGMRRGDVLLRYDGQELDQVATLRRLTSAYAQGASAQKRIAIEAARGTDDVVFDVSGGKLGITLSPLLYRRGARKSVWKRLLQKVFGTATGETGRGVMPQVVHTLDEASRHDRAAPALALVPGDLARPVLGVLRALHQGGSRKGGKRARSLLLAARRSG
jgi:membrane-associated protease RseP (regulator of RpoE activity)